MARNIKEIQDSIVTALRERFANLSTSAVAEWRLLTYVVATAIHTFEIILDQFRGEMEDLTRKTGVGTERWYAEQAKRFQNGHELVFDTETARYFYAKDDPVARICKIVAVSGANYTVAIKVAKLDSDGAIKPFLPDELQNFTGYMDTIKVAGPKVSVISTTPDMLRYNIEVYYDTVYPKTAIEARVKQALQNFKTTIRFDGTLYGQRFIDALLHCEGVITVNAVLLERKGATETDYTPVGVKSQLHSGYFDYSEDCKLTLTLVSNED